MVIRSDVLDRLPAEAAGDLPALNCVSPTISTSIRPGHKQIFFAVLLSLGLAIIGIACTPLASTSLAPIPGFMTAFGAGMFVINALLATLLLSKGSIEGRADVTRLGAAYLLVAAIFVPLTLSFKDGFVPGTLIGTPASSVWLWSTWHSGFALAISWYAINVGSSRPAPSIWKIALCVVGLITLLAILMTAGVEYLPPVLGKDKILFSGYMYAIPVVLLSINVAALFFCLSLRARSTEQLWVTVAMVAACFDLWLTMHGGNRFALGWYLSKCGSFITSLVVIASLFHDITELYRSSAKTNRVLTDLAQRDGLTGIYNRRYFDEMLEKEWVRAKRDRLPLSLLMVDVDFFKQFNDKYGHLVGDDCLRAVARCLSEAVRRPTDVVTRYGGEEFAVLLPNTPETGSLKVAEYLLAAVENLMIPHSHSSCGRLTASIGVSTNVPNFDGRPHALLRAADEALYQAKQQGRNRVASSASILSAEGDVIPFEKRTGGVERSSAA